MTCRFNASYKRVLAFMLAAASIPTAAQVTSKAAHVTIIAIMPETISLSINVSNSVLPGSATATAGNPSVAEGVTTAWSLMAGRDRVSTWTTVNHVSSPALVAAISPVGVDPFREERMQDSAPRGFALRSNISSTEMTGTSLTDTNRRGTSTAALPDSIDSGKSPSPPNTPLKTLKIQVQPVL